jgi:hypothetical protein
MVTRLKTQEWQCKCWRAVALPAANNSCATFLPFGKTREILLSKECINARTFISQAGFSHYKTQSNIQIYSLRQSILAQAIALLSSNRVALGFKFGLRHRLCSVLFIPSWHISCVMSKLTTLQSVHYSLLPGLSKYICPLPRRPLINYKQKFSTRNKHSAIWSKCCNIFANICNNSRRFKSFKFSTRGCMLLYLFTRSLLKLMC